jgi:folate-binding protein YgfZ
VIIEESFGKNLSEHLDRYIKLSRVEVKRLNKHVYFDIAPQAGPAVKGVVVIPQKAGTLVISDDKLKCAVSEEAFTLFRLNNDIPFHGIDYTDDFALNVTGEDIVSFEKGCFLGQEPVSKVHNRSSPTWKLVVKYDNECTQEEKEKMTSQAPDPDSGRILGFVFERAKR